MNTDESIRFATKYLEDLLSFFGINVAVYSTIEDDVIQLSIPSTSMNSLLIGKNANNLRALQHVLMMTLIARNAEVTRVNIDIADYKRQRADKIEHQGSVGTIGDSPAHKAVPEAGKPANPALDFSLYGETFASPIMTAALSHLSHFMFEGAADMLAKGAKAANAVFTSLRKIFNKNQQLRTPPLKRWSFLMSH